jgi:hypothetical protein
LRFQWFHVRDLEHLDLRPSFLRESLGKGMDGGTRHIVHDDRQHQAS